MKVWTSTVGLLMLLTLGWQVDRGSSPAADGDAGASLRSDPMTWPDQKSSAPSSAEWREAAEVHVTRKVGRLAQSCRVKRVREWAFLRCDDVVISSMTQLGGTNRGLSFHLDTAAENGVPKAGVAIFPLRRGDRRALLIWTLGPGYDGPLTVIPGIVVQAEWTGEHPVFLLHDAIHEPVLTATGAKRDADTQSEEMNP